MPDAGVPNAGVTSVGLVAKTTEPVPVAVVDPVPPLATGRVPVTPVVKGRPVTLVSVPLDGVPKAGVTSVGLVAKTTEPVPVAVVDPVPPFSMATIPVTFAAVPVVFWFNVGNVQFVSVPDAGVPKAGAINVVPVSVNPLIVVTVSPSATAVVPSVAAVLKFASSRDSGMLVVALANV